jgi:putative DNA primase/helicase
MSAPQNGERATADAHDLNYLSILTIYDALSGRISPSTIGKREAMGTCWGPHTNGTDHYNLRLNDEKGVFNCHCGGKGDKLDLVVFAGAASDRKSAWRWLVKRRLVAKYEHTNGNPARTPGEGVKPRTVAEYRYKYEDGNLVARVDRVEPGRDGKDKDFYPHLWDGTKFKNPPGLNNRKLPLYGLPEIRKAIDAEERLFFTEGEGKGDRLRAALQAAKVAGAVTTIHGGSEAQLTEDHLYQLRGLKSAVILADSDEKGRAAAHRRAERIARMGATVKILDFYPEATTKEHPAWAWDVADFLKAGGTVEQLLAFIESAPVVEPSAATATNEDEAKKTGTSTPNIERTFTRMDTSNMVTTVPQYVCFNILRQSLTIIEGIGAVGKSTLMYWISAALTRGAEFTDGSKNDPMNVAIISIEDIPDIIIEKLRLYKVDHARLHLLPSMNDGSGKPRRFIIDQDARSLRDYITKHKIDVLYIDAFVSHVGHGIDLWKGQAARDVMTILHEIAISTGCAIVITRHWKKGLGPASERGANSNEIRNVARSSMVVGLHPDNPDIHVLAPEKGNYKKGGGQSYGFRIEPCNVTFGDGKEFDLGRLVPIGPVDVTADDISLAEAKTSKERSAISEARQALLQALLEGPLHIVELSERVKGDGHAQRTIERAMHTLHQEKLIAREGGWKGIKISWSLTNRGRRAAMGTVGDESSPIASLQRTEKVGEPGEPGEPSEPGEPGEPYALFGICAQKDSPGSPGFPYPARARTFGGPLADSRPSVSDTRGEI